MKEELKNNLLMKFTEDVEFVKDLVRDVLIIDFDNRPGWHPFPDKVMEEKIEEHYKRIGKNIYEKVSAAKEELENQRDAKRQRTETESIGGKKRHKSRRRKRTKKRRKSRRRKRR